jgi:hypothetical protein
VFRGEVRVGAGAELLLCGAGGEVRTAGSTEDELVHAVSVVRAARAAAARRAVITKHMPQSRTG